MMQPETEARRPGRPKRAEVTDTQRRRRSGGQTDKLAIPPAILEAYPEMEFRYGSDRPGRMQQLTVHDDWDKVPDVEPIHGGKGENGRAEQLHLLMKPKAFMEEDRREKAKRIADTVQSKLDHPDAQTATETGAEMYAVPGNKL